MFYYARIKQLNFKNYLIKHLKISDSLSYYTWMAREKGEQGWERECQNEGGKEGDREGETERDRETTRTEGECSISHELAMNSIHCNLCYEWRTL